VSLKSTFFDKINDSDYNSNKLTTLLLSTTQMADTKNPVIPVAQDLQINLEEAPKTEIQPST